MRRILLLIGCFVALNGKADEGMWLLPLIERLNIDTMHSLGFKLSASDIYSINHSSLKDAIVMFGAGCTGEIVSESGLLFTNHHCGFDAIQNHSSVEHNYLNDGFWAMNREQELPNPDLSVTFLISIEDVTETVLGSFADTMAEDARNLRVALLADSISQVAIAGTHYKAEVKPLFGGNSYYLFVYEVYQDVRLVGAPPTSIGKFGHDTDNWMWPRHTGDFSIFRVYSGPDGKPAKFSAKNIPLKPKHFLPVSLKERNIDDFALVLGYPGTTTRYMTSFEISELMEITNPNRIKIRGLRLDILRKDMQANEAVNIQYAYKYNSSSNYWKYSIGQNQGLKQLSIVEKKQQEERDFTNWVNADELRKVKYGEALDMIRKSVEDRALRKHVLQYTYESLFTASELIAFANYANSLHSVLKSTPDNKELIRSTAVMLKSRWDGFTEEYNQATDMKVIPAMLKLYKDNVPEDYLPDFYDQIKLKYKNDYNAFVQNMFAKSIFVNKEKFEAFISNPSVSILEKDPAFQVALSAGVVYRRTYYGEAFMNSLFKRGQRLYIAGLMEMDSGKSFYPDANSTMRMSYGTVQDYVPRDAVHYDYYTTATGIMEKEDPDSWEFIVPEKLKTLYKNRDYGNYGVQDKMPVCFITNNDITGGNSGSPVIDEEGNLIGLAFDGNWEAMSSNIAFEPELQRCICVDIRFVLFIMDKFAGATHLINELKIIQ